LNILFKVSKIKGLIRCLGYCFTWPYPGSAPLASASLAPGSLRAMTFYFAGGPDGCRRSAFTRDPGKRRPRRNAFCFFKQEEIKVLAKEPGFKDLGPARSRTWHNADFLAGSMDAVLPSV
jgi:hypothetical protein